MDAELFRRVPDDDRSARRACGRRAGEIEKRSHLAEVLTGAERRQQLDLLVGSSALDRDLARLDDVDLVAPRPLVEQDLVRGQLDARGRGRRIVELRDHLDDLVGERQEPVVVRGHHDHPPGRSELPEQPEHAFDLDVIQTRRRLVRDDQLRVVGECPGE